MHAIYQSDECYINTCIYSTSQYIRTLIPKCTFNDSQILKDDTKWEKIQYWGKLITIHIYNLLTVKLPVKTNQLINRLINRFHWIGCLLIININRISQFTRSSQKIGLFTRFTQVPLIQYVFIQYRMFSYQMHTWSIISLKIFATLVH